VSHSLSGILPAVVTPLTADGIFAAQPFERLLARLYGADVDGIYVCGQTGEGLPQSVAQRKLVTEAAVANSPKGRHVIVHTGAYATVDALELTRHASRLGVAAVSSLPPAGPYSFAEIKAYYQALAAASDVPVLVYYFPEICPTINSLPLIQELCAIPGVIGLKFTDFNLYRLSILKQQGALIYNGRDEVLAAGLLMGADGGIGTFYNLTPELFVACWKLSRASHWPEARLIQDRINELIEITLRFPALAAVKQLLTWSGIDCGACLGPRRPLAAEEAELLRAQIAASSHAGLLNPETHSL
jgi:N-acetylneuraminate lyase